jgi:hypothetical protein
MMSQDEAISTQAQRFSEAVENTVAGGQGALTTGQAKNEGGHVTVFNLLLNHIRQLKQFDVVNTTGARLTPLWRPPKASPQTTRSSVALCRYQPEFQAIVMSIDMGLPLDTLGKQRHVRLQMFVRGPYTGLHRYVASDANVPLHTSASNDAGHAFHYDMQNGMLDPFTLYWRPALFNASYPYGYYSFNRESALIYAKLNAWNTDNGTRNPGVTPAQLLNSDWGFNANVVMAHRLAWQNVAATAGAVYAAPVGSGDRGNPWQFVISQRGQDPGEVREYPPL